MRSLKSVIVITLLAYGLSSCTKSKSTVKDANVAIPVNVTTVKFQDIEQKLNFLGNVEAFQEVKVYSTVPTRILQMNVDVGQMVKKGDVLAIVDNEKIKQGVIQAEAGLEAARAQARNLEVEYNRIQRLFNENAVSKSQFDAIKTQYEASNATVKQLEAALSNAKAQLKDSYVTTPIDGVVASRTLNEGDQTSPQMPLFSIVQMNRVKVAVEVVESQISLIKPGQTAYLEVNPYPNQRFTGKVEKIYPTLNPVARTVTAEIIVDNSNNLLKPGMYAKVTIVIDRHKNAMVIPKFAVLERTSLKYLGGELSNTVVTVDRYVYVVKDSIALQHAIQTGIEDGALVEVRSGLAPNQLIVTLGQHNLYDSALVSIVKKES